MPHTFIIGNTGSGKSTLAKRLAATSGLPHVDLDRFAWGPDITVRRALDDSLAALGEELRGAAAVFDGMYADLVQALIRSEDRLLWLDLPVEQCIAHCERRPFEPHKWEDAEKQNAFLPSLLDFLRTYPEREDELGRAAHERLYQLHGGPKNRVLSVREADALIV